MSVQHRFVREANFWDGVYRENDVFSRIHRRRRQIALGWASELPLPKRPRVLEIGCGAGGASVALGQHGFRVDATDVVWSMIELTRRHLDSAGVGSGVRASLTDATEIGFRAGQFELVLALGVLPWLDDVAAALQEMSRVLVPGGFVIANVDNRARLDMWLDPRRNPALCRTIGRAPCARLQTRSEFTSMLRLAGFEPLRGCMLGFGPLTFFGHNVMPNALGTRFEEWLQHLADRGLPAIHSVGAQWLVAARKAG